MNYYITVSGDWGDCMVDYDGEPCYSLDNAMKFESEYEAQDYIDKHNKEWVGVSENYDKMTICKIED